MSRDFNEILGDIDKKHADSLVRDSLKSFQNKSKLLSEKEAPEVFVIKSPEHIGSKVLRGYSFGISDLSNTSAIETKVYDLYGLSDSELEEVANNIMKRIESEGFAFLRASISGNPEVMGKDDLSKYRAAFNEDKPEDPDMNQKNRIRPRIR